MASDLKKERDELQQELYRVTENERLYRNLAESRAEKLNNLNKSYDELLARFNAREEDLFRTQKEVIIQRHRADNNYDANQDRNKIIAAQKRRIFELESSEKALKETINALQRRNPVPHASWEAAYNIEREQKIQAYKDVEALKWENEDLKKGVYRNGGCAGCKYWETRHKQLEASIAIMDKKADEKDMLIVQLKKQIDRMSVGAHKTFNQLESKHEQYEKTITDLRKLADTYYNELVARGNKIDDYEKRIIDLRESSQQKTKLIESLNKRIDGLEMDLRIATNDRERWKKYYNDCGQSLELWKKKHSELMENSQVAFAKVNDLQEELKVIKTCDKLRLPLLDKVIELEAEIGRLSKFEPLEPAELKELEYLRAEYENAKNTIKSQELTYNNLLENSKLIEKENTELYDKYDKLKTGIETLCEANNIRE